MSPRDVAECAIGALLTVIWWWFWYGIVITILGNTWGFLIVLGLVFAVEIVKKSAKKTSKEEVTQ